MGYYDISMCMHAYIMVIRILNAEVFMKKLSKVVLLSLLVAVSLICFVGCSKSTNDTMDEQDSTVIDTYLNEVEKLVIAGEKIGTFDASSETLDALSAVENDVQYEGLWDEYEWNSDRRSRLEKLTERAYNIGW